MPAPDFDSVARYYDALAGLVFGPRLLAAQRLALARGLPDEAARVLFIGGGTGRVLPELLQAGRAGQVLYLEASAEMLARAAQHLAATAPELLARVEFRHGTEAALRPDEQFDAVLAFFLFDLFPAPELHALLQRLQPHTHARTRWLVADFAPPRQSWQRGLQWLMYRFFGLTSGVAGRQLPDIAGALARLGLRPQWQQRLSGGLVEASAWEAGA
ncbi:class I SAM-dependent methyltransferase [Hymenobacter gummosus]|nr:class I SAM-dependent methyltransferase [Hymenobacter gummosus]